MTKERKMPDLLPRQMAFCPGCGHGVASRLICECLEELGQEKNIIFPIGVGCSSNLGNGLEADRIHCLHGRAGAVATAVKRVNPENIVITYQGDGDAYNIGMAESVHAALRGENITVIVINNTNFGMTGGQMSVTTMPGQVTATSKRGKDPALFGNPIRFPEMVAEQFDVAYAARGAINNPQNINKTKTYIKNAIEAQLNGEGYSIVEILSPCPVNWNMDPLAAIERINNELIPYFPVGVIKERKAK